MDWIEVALDTDWLWEIVNALLKLRIPYIMVIF